MPAFFIGAPGKAHVLESEGRETDASLLCTRQGEALAEQQGQDFMFEQHNHTHNHTWSHSYGCDTRAGVNWPFASFYSFQGSATETFSTEDAPATSGNYGTETRPVNMSVVWIMRVK